MKKMMPKQPMMPMGKQRMLPMQKMMKQKMALNEFAPMPGKKRKKGKK